MIDSTQTPKKGWWKQFVDNRLLMLPEVLLSTAVKLFCRPTEHLGSSGALMSVLL